MKQTPCALKIKKKKERNWRFRSVLPKINLLWEMGQIRVSASVSLFPEPENKDNTYLVYLALS